MTVVRMLETGVRALIMGLGDAGIDAVERLLGYRMPGAEFMAVHSSKEAVLRSRAATRLHLACPPIETPLAYQMLCERIAASDYLMILAGAGDADASASLAAISTIAREKKVLTIGILHMPAPHEGTFRAYAARREMLMMRSVLDALIPLPAQPAPSHFPGMRHLSRGSLDVGSQIIAGCFALVAFHDVVSADFEKFREALSLSGLLGVGIGSASGPDRIPQAVAAAFASTLIDHAALEKAEYVMFIASGVRDTLKPNISSRIRSEISSHLPGFPEMNYAIQHESAPGDQITIMLMFPSAGLLPEVVHPGG